MIQRYCATALLAAVAMGGCDDTNTTGTTEDESASGMPEVVRAGDVVELPCADAVLMPSGAWAAVDPSGADYELRRSGTVEWRCPGRDLGGEIRVRPGPPETLSLARWPDAVRVGSSRALEARLVDAFGNEIEGAEIELSAEPTHRVRRFGGGGSPHRRERIRFLSRGRVRISAIADLGSGPPLRAEHELVVDAGPPVVQLTSPERGAIVRRRLARGVRVSGHVDEDGPDVTLYVAGREVAVEKDGSFETVIVPPRTGLDVLTYRAVDQVGHETAGSRAVLYGPLRNPRDGLDQAAVVFLPSDLLDDDDPSDVDDVATALSVLVDALDVPNQHIDFGCKGAIDLENIALSISEIDLEPTEEGVDVAVRLSDVSLDVSGEACGCAYGMQVACVSTSATVKAAWVAFEVATRIGHAGPTKIETRRANVELSPLTVHWQFLGGRLDWAVQLFESAIRTELRDALRSTLEARVRADLGTVLSTLVPVQTIALPPPLDDKVAVETELTRLSTSPDGVRFEVRTHALPTGVPLPDTSIPGQFAHLTVRATDPAPEALLASGPRIGLGVSLDVVNDAIYSLYARGGLDDLVIDLDRIAPGTAAADAVPAPLSLHASLPPMILPSLRRDALQLVVGDLLVRIDTGLDSISVYVSITVDIAISFDEARQSIVLELIEDGLSVHFEPATVADAISLSAMFRDVEQTIRAVVAESLVGRELAVPVPAFDLAQIEGVPRERATPLRLSETEVRIDDSGYLVVRGQLVARQ